MPTAKKQTIDWKPFSQKHKDLSSLADMLRDDQPAEIKEEDDGTRIE